MGFLFHQKVMLPGVGVILALIVIAIFASLIASFDPYKMQLSDALLQPSGAHLLGTDELGRDVLSRLIYGTRISLLVGVIAVSFAALTGVPLGLIAGYFGGVAEMLIMRFVDALMAFPPIVLALGLAFALGGGLVNCMVAVGITIMPMFARIAYGQAIVIKETDYITAARVVGCSNLRIIFYHVLRNTVPLLIIVATLNLGIAILYEAALSFLGVGINPPGAAWGSMLRSGYPYLMSNPLLCMAPGVCILIVVLSFNLVGDAVRDLLDPRLRGRI